MAMMVTVRAGMHVCEIIKSLDLGGAEMLLASRLLATPFTGKRYTVVCLQASTGELIERLRSAGIRVVDLTSCPPASRLLRLATVVSSLRPDVVNLHSPLPAALIRLTSRLSRPRPALVSTVHNVRYRTPTMLLDRATGWLDSCTVAVSSQVARAVVSRGARDLRTRIHGVDVAEQRRAAMDAAGARSEWDVPESAFLIVHVANLRPQKDHETLVQAAATVVARAPQAMFLLAGTGPLHDQVVRRVAALGSDRVRFLGGVPGAARLVAAADLLVLSSAHEGLPVVVMEALAAGVPVVSTRVGGVPELVKDGHNGYLTGPGDPDALAGAILRAMQPASHARLREGARNSADLVDIGQTAVWFDKLYDEVCSR
jgi:glycosyltransferase involved in cell wall biosynthesis